ncbi:uncharacterized protein LOC133805490 [Humulus lupulus]|uniref:uncharacterized protein LOC133805490 n=1 Tax=Humulus lupulus TaxID=3486 RepID=UPI002B4037AE|nr:uncharacterized protein LOC133805490 [Humulus lupulus]
MTTKMKKGVSVREYVLSMNNMMHEVEIRGVVIDERTQLLNELQTFESFNKTITKETGANMIGEKPSTFEDKTKKRKKNNDKDKDLIIRIMEDEDASAKTNGGDDIKDYKLFSPQASPPRPSFPRSVTRSLSSANDSYFKGTSTGNSQLQKPKPKPKPKPMPLLLMAHLQSQSDTSNTSSPSATNNPPSIQLGVPEDSTQSRESSTSSNLATVECEAPPLTTKAASSSKSASDAPSSLNLATVESEAPPSTAETTDAATVESEAPPPTAETTDAPSSLNLATVESESPPPPPPPPPTTMTTEAHHSRRARSSSNKLRSLQEFADLTSIFLEWEPNKSRQSSSTSLPSETPDVQLDDNTAFPPLK